MWDLAPWPGIEPGPHALRAQSLSHWTTGEVPWLPSFYDMSANSWTTFLFLLSSAWKGEEEAGIWAGGMATDGSFKADY